MQELSDFLKREFSREAYYYLLPWGLGDAMIFSGLKNALETKLGSKIIPVVKPSQELIMKMYAITEYQVVPINALDIQQHALLEKQGIACPVPTKGKVYIAHPEFHPQFSYLSQEMGNPTSKTKFLRWYKNFFEIAYSTKMELPVWYPSVSSELRKLIRDTVGAEVEEIIMVLPEANSADGIAPAFWHKILHSLAGEKLVTNIRNIANFPEFSVIPNVDINLEDLTALCLNCKEVFAVRSGLCDLIFHKGRKLHVFYPTSNIFHVFTLKDMFGTDAVHESISEDVIREYVQVMPASRKKLGFLKSVFCNKITRFYFFGINFFSWVEK